MSVANHPVADQKERDLALDPRQSFIVQAPAGSGKTELLIQRLLLLLSYVKSPEEILAITFTKKAANEMRSRAIHALKEAQNTCASLSSSTTLKLAKKVLQRDAQYQWNLIANPNQLRIQTIDSLCSYLTKQLPLLAHFGAQPNIVENPVNLYSEAVQEILHHVEEQDEWSHAIKHLLLHLDNDLNKLHHLLTNLLAKRDQWLPYIQLETNDKVRKRLESHLQSVISDALQNVSQHFPAEAKEVLLRIARFAGNNHFTLQHKTEIVLCRDLVDLPGIYPNDLPYWRGLARLLLTKKLTWRKRLDNEIGFPSLSTIKNPQEKAEHTALRQQHTLLMQTLSQQEALRAALVELFYLPPPHYSDDQWAIFSSLLYILKMVTAQLRLSFSQHGQIDFIENTQAALLALGNDEHPTDLALLLDYQIKHILVDEFQDTSYSQYQLLERLVMGWEANDGRTLFVVGDPMQSIYRFREAEVGLFIRMCAKGIAHIPLKLLTLSVNFRSASPIIDWNNQQFATIFPAMNDMATGAVSYSPSISAEETHTHARVSMKGFIGAEEAQQTAHLIQLIEEERQHFPKDSIAILVRSRNVLLKLIPALKKAEIPYIARDIDPLAKRQSIQDLVSLTCALLHPADRIAWLAILRAPWCGLSLCDLHAIAGESPHSILWETLQNTALLTKLSKEGQAALKRTLPVLKNAIAARERYGLRQWVESTWLGLGGPATLEDELEVQDTHVFFSLLDDIHQQESLLTLDSIKEKIETLYAGTLEEETQLNIMTIHSAKGLEFDTVILPHLEKRPPNENKSLLNWIERPLTNNQIAFLLAPIHATGTEKDTLYEYIHRQQKIKVDYESDRIFYVAATRAKKRLHLVFQAEEKNGEIHINHGSFLEKIKHLLSKEKMFAESSFEPMTLPHERQTQLVRGLRRLTDDWVNPLATLLSKPSQHHQQQSGFQLPHTTPRLLGTIIHRILQYISVNGMAWWQNETQDKKKNYLILHLRQAGLISKDIAASITRIENVIDKTLKDPRGQWILHPHREAKSEFSLTLKTQGKAEIGIIDRTFIDEKGIRWIIDYKTTTYSYSDLDLFLKNEQKKYLSKMRLYDRAMSAYDPRPCRLGLYFPALLAWKEWEGESEMSLSPV